MNELILIVEDSRTQAMILENILESQSYRVAIAADGEEALQWLSENKPSLVISDIVMPGMDGYELCRQIKTQKTTNDIPVILLTSLNRTEEVIEGLVAGAESFITKPYDQDYLILHIEKILADQSGISTEKESFGVEILFEGKKRFIQSDQQQMIRLLRNIYEGAIQQNQKLLQTQEKLKYMNENLESMVEERTDKLETQNALLNALINSPADIIIFSLNKNYRYTTFNDRYRREMKNIWNADIEIGTNLLDCMHDPELRTLAKISIDRTLKGEAFSEIQYQPQQDIYFEFYWNPIFQGNEVIGITVFVMDITNRKRTEKEIQVKNEELQKVNAEKDKFFSIIAHDLRSPLSSFLGFTQLMVEELPSMELADLQEMAVSMEKSATNLFRLLENLLEWAKIQRGLVPFNPEVIQLNSIVGESVEMLIESIKNKEIEITYDVPADSWVIADSNMLQTVIRNLVSNAVKFTPKGGKISLLAKATGNQSFEISIKDKGIGMSPVQLDHLFQLNNQINRPGTEGEPSSGLGLLLCKEFIEKIGGKIWVESEVGVGSEFSFTIPLNVISEQTSNQQSRSWIKVN
jgi:signal transduction histidine kinase/CheY-like chemotaxis protein